MLKFAIILAALCYGGHANKIYLYRVGRTELNPAAPESWLEDGFDLSQETIILIHGHGESDDGDFSSTIRNYLNFGSHNVLSLEWNADRNYETSLRNFPVAAEFLTDILNKINNLVGPPGQGQPPSPPLEGDLSKVQLVGFHLGAHIAGLASRNAVTRVAKITGLDPAGNRMGNNFNRLRREDADYVQVLHTDGSGLLANGIGAESGDVDFYANGGSNQPGCLSHSCSHNRAYELFAASLVQPLFGTKCSSRAQLNLNLCRGVKIEMGGISLERPDNHHAGIYRLNTGRRWPFQ